ncbi:MAG: penicillin-binding protein transpeptidase [Frankiales bacterium]|nr:penicillin-binding protein transpeptidase [Frankiales bacterium]
MSRRWTAAAVALVLLAGVAVWQVPRLLGDDGHGAAAESFARAWTDGALADLPWDPVSDPDAATRIEAVTAGLTPAPQERPAEVTVASVTRDGGRATAQLEVRWELGVPWRYETTLPLQKVGDVWRPVLRPSVVHPDLTDGQLLRSRIVQTDRAPITDRDGAPIVQGRPVVVVGVQPSRAPDAAATVARLAALVDVDGDALLRRVQAARPDAFVEVITLRRPAYDAQRAELRPIPGVVFREEQRQLAPTSAFARALLGAVGPATAEVVEASGGKVRADQVVGLSGLQERYDAQLGGTPGFLVEAVDAEGQPVQVLLDQAAEPGAPLQLTLDPRVQQAADAALESAPEGKRAALVVLQPSTGDVLAVANAGPDGPGADRALTGRYPPGSTFKIASTLALLREGLTVDEVVPCPATTTVQGKSFKNAEDEVLGDQPFRTDFAHSCNTAFVGSADRITAQQLQQAARDVGYGEHDLGVGAFGGEVPAGADPVEHAAQVIGQGKVLASPLAVAVSAATVAAGRLRPPRLLMEPAAPAPGDPLPQAADLQALTRAVVTEGTAPVLRDVPGEPVSGKTGTAEYGTEVPPRTHAWFAGYSGDLAFAVLVEDGGFGGAVAAPVARDLLLRLR